MLALFKNACSCLPPAGAAFGCGAFIRRAGMLPCLVLPSYALSHFPNYMLYTVPPALKITQKRSKMGDGAGIIPLQRLCPLPPLYAPSVSTVYSMMDDARRDLSIITIKKLCDGLDMSLGEFFSTPEFDALEQEIK